MKKIRITGGKTPSFWNKSLRLMKLTFLFFLVGLMQLSASVYSQSAKLSLEMRKAKVAEVLDAIESQSEFRFAYSPGFVDLNREVTIDIHNKTIDESLELIFADTEVVYGIFDRHILLYPESMNPGAEPVISHSTGAQQRTISGKVSDVAGEPLPGVTILIKGTTHGTVTNAEGNYSLTNIPDGATLVFSFVGMRTQEIEAGQQTTVNVQMEIDAIGIEEVVAIGYGTRKKSDLTGSISMVGAESLEKANSVSPQFALQGNTTGVRVVNTSGDPNAAPRIFVRGIGTWQGTAQPLYVIDGQIIIPPSDGNEDVISGFGDDTPPNLWSLINPNDIESITVLKDASAAAIYGSRGANGVILITTKRGKKGDATIEFNSQYGVQNIPTNNMLNTTQYVDLVNEMYANNKNPDISIERNLFGRDETSDDVRRISYSPQFDPQSPFYISSRETYDWQDHLIRTNAVDQTYDLKVSGASDRTDYFVSLGYKDQESNFVGGGMTRYTASVNLNTQAKKWLKVGVNYKFSYQETDSDDRSTLPQIADVAPWQPIFDPSTPSGFAHVIDARIGDWQHRKFYGQGSNNNDLALMEFGRRDFILQRHIGQGYFELFPIKGLTLRGSLNLDLTSQDRQGLTIFEGNVFLTEGRDPQTAAPAARNSLASLGFRENNIYNYQSDFTATYDREFGKNRITVTGVVQDQFHQREYRDFGGANINNIKNIERVGYGGDLANNNSFYGWSEKFWFGLAGRVSYIYDSKYYLDISARRDASSGFDKDYRWGNFYSVSGAWRISSESFMENVTWLDDLKLRGGWGEAGNDETVVGSFAYLSRAGGSGSYRFGSGGDNPIGTYYIATPVKSFPNPSLTWEVAVTSYAGFDALLLNNRFNLTVELFNRKTKGIQQIVNLPLSVGTSDPALNIGELVNKGADILMGYNDNFGDFNFGVTGNISFIKNEVVKLYNKQPLSTGFGRIEEGRSVGHLWGYQLGGIFQNQTEIDAYYQNITEDQVVSNVDYIAPGDMYFKEIGGNPTADEPFYSTTPDGIMNTYDQTEIGNTIPGYTYGINLNAGWKGFDLSLSFYGEGDVQKFNAVRRTIESMSGAGPNYSVSTLDRWTSTNPSTTMPRAVVNDPAGNNRYSDRFVESAAFFRLNNWQLGYNIPDNLLTNINHIVSSLRVYVSGQNNLYMFKWTGVDPVNDHRPLTQTINFGIKARF